MRFATTLVSTKVLIVDDIHNALTGNASKTREFLNVLRFLGNSLKLPIVAAGVREAAQVIAADDQTANRFLSVEVPRWSNDELYWTLLDTIEWITPLRRPSNLSDPRIADAIFERSEGLLGEIVTIVALASIEAIRNRSERIGLELIRKTEFVRPSQRRFIAMG